MQGATIKITLYLFIYLLIVYSSTPSINQIIESGMIMWVVDKFGATPRVLHGKTDKNHETFFGLLCLVTSI